MRHYTLDEKLSPVLENDITRWAIKFQGMDRKIRKTVLESNSGEGEEITVSTIFLGLDHSMRDSGAPVLFETMVFNGELDGYIERYGTVQEAELGHRQVVIDVIMSEKAGFSIIEHG